MKLKFNFLLLFVLLIGVATSCKKKASPFSCLNHTVKYADTYTAFANNQTRGNCEAVKRSIKELYKGCGALSAVDKEEYEDFERDFDCSDYN